MLVGIVLTYLHTHQACLHHQAISSATIRGMICVTKLVSISLSI